MYRMLTCFNLKPGTSLDQFQSALDALSAWLIDHQLIINTGPIGRRHRHPVMDTDDQRNHEYFFLMNFADLAQCDRAVELFRPREAPVEPLHGAVIDKISEPVFICWEDVTPT